MDFLWKENGYDLRMSPYSVVMTGPNSGMIQVSLLDIPTLFFSIQDHRLYLHR
jgi:hypothetical protein